jgi:hypothetical protein
VVRICLNYSDLQLERIAQKILVRFGVGSWQVCGVVIFLPYPRTNATLEHIQGGKRGGIRPGGGVTHICFESSVCCQPSCSCREPPFDSGPGHNIVKKSFFFAPSEGILCDECIFFFANHKKAKEYGTGRIKTGRRSSPHLCSIGS